jgi:hypothetical protein
MGCVEKFAQFLKKFYVPDAIVKTLKDDCENLEECFTKDCIPIFNEPKENNKFLELNEEAKITGERYPISDYLDVLNEYEKKVYDTIIKNFRNIVNYYKNNKKYYDAQDALRFYTDQKLFEENKILILLDGMTIEEPEGRTQLDEEEIKSFEITMFYDYDYMEHFTHALQYVSLSKKYAEKLLKIADVISNLGYYLPFSEILYAVSKQYPELTIKHSQIAIDLLKLILERELYENHHADFNLDLSSSTLENLSRYFLNLSKIDKKYIPYFFETTRIGFGWSTLEVLYDAIDVIPITDEILEQAPEEFVIYAYGKKQIKNVNHLIRIIKSRRIESQYDCNSITDAMKKYKNDLEKCNDSDILRKLIICLRDPELLIRNLDKINLKDLQLEEILRDPKIPIESILKLEKEYKNFDKIICKIIPFRKELLKYIDVIKYECLSSLPLLSEEEIAKKQKEIYSLLKKHEKDFPAYISRIRKILTKLNPNTEKPTLLDVLILIYKKREDSLKKHKEEVKKILKENPWIGYLLSNTEIAIDFQLEITDIDTAIKIEQKYDAEQLISPIIRPLVFAKLKKKLKDPTVLSLSKDNIFLDSLRYSNLARYSREDFFPKSPEILLDEYKENIIEYLKTLTKDEIKNILDELKKKTRITATLIDAVAQIDKNLAIQYLQYIKNKTEYCKESLKVNIYPEQCIDYFIRDYNSRKNIKNADQNFAYKVIEKCPPISSRLGKQERLQILTRLFNKTKEENKKQLIVHEIFETDPETALKIQKQPDLQTAIWALDKGIFYEIEDPKYLAWLSLYDKEKALKHKEKIIQILKEIKIERETYYSLIYAINTKLNEIPNFWKSILEDYTQN